MARAVEQIDREIAAVKQQVEAIAQDLYLTNQQYLLVLSQTLRQQLIMAVYHLCTQGYPEEFLDLPLHEQQELQQSLQRITQQTQQHLIYALQPLAATPADANQEEQTAQQQAMQIALTPDDCVDWQEKLEEQVSKLLQDASHATNRLLQQSGILSNNFPETILEVATMTGMAAEPTIGPPNLLNLLVETEPNESETGKLTHIMAIRLRLAELEFNDPTLTGWRNKIRTLLNRLQQLKQEYQKKHHERTIAKAELAWRASWYED